MKRSFRRLIRIIQRHLTKDLLKPPYGGVDGEPGVCHEGHCYVACEALFHLGAGAVGFKPRVLTHREWPVLKKGRTHWFLARGAIVLDPTAAQFKTDPPYDLGRGCGFLTKQPSRRAWTLMERAKASCSPAHTPRTCRSTMHSNKANFASNGGTTVRTPITIRPSFWTGPAPEPPTMELQIFQPESRHKSALNSPKSYSILMTPEEMRDLGRELIAKANQAEDVTRERDKKLADVT